MDRLATSTREVLLVILMTMYTAANAEYYNDDKSCYGFGGTIVPRSFGNLYRYHINVYRDVAANLYYSVRPGLRYFMPNKYFMLGIQYNFLIGVTNFGKATDFRGFQFIAGIKTGKDNKKTEPLLLGGGQ